MNRALIRADLPAPLYRRRRRPRSGMTLLDVLVAAAVVVVVSGAVIAGPLVRARETANRVKCSNNLRQIALAAIMYANQEVRTGAFPRTYFNPDSAALITDTTGYAKPSSFERKDTGDNNVTASFFLILKTQEITPDTFVCPSTRAKRGFAAASDVSIQDSSNWEKIPENLSYGYNCPFPGPAAVKAGWKFNNSLGPDHPLAGDMNPGGDALPGLVPKAAVAQMRQGNSRNHRQDGQNIVYCDAHVEFQLTPFCGAPVTGAAPGRDDWRDNVYTYGSVTDKKGGDGVVGMPTGPIDSVLLPTGGEGRATTRPAPPPRGPYALTLEQARRQLALNPRDPYLQFVVLQLARREGILDEVAEEVRGLSGRPEQEQPDQEQVNLFGLFTGALAVQESLQLEEMRSEEGGRDGGRRAGQRPPATQPQAQAGPVDLSALAGPQVKSHPWERMLAARQAPPPKLSSLAGAVPEDFYLVQFRSLAALLEAAETADRWGSHLSVQSSEPARSRRVGERLQRQLALSADPVLRAFYDQVVQEVAVTGSDLFLREGSDVTVLLRLKRPELFRSRSDALLAEAQNSRTDAKRTTVQVGGLACVNVSTPDREISAWCADPAPDLHVRSNSRVALERVLATLGGKQGAGEPGPLARSREFVYIRTLMPEGSAEEDGFVYLSDPFIRRQVGPKLKITERRRVLCYNHLRMIGHAAALHRTEFARPAASLRELADTQCAPGLFGEGKLGCPDGGKYELAPGGMGGTCSVHGTAHFLTPCCEIPLGQATSEEARLYRAFLEQYNQHWRTYFDPIAVRVAVSPQRYRLETLILPLIDNSIYTGLARALGGEPQPLDALPVPKRNIFSVAVKLNKEDLLKNRTADGRDPLDAMEEAAAEWMGESSVGDAAAAGPRAGPGPAVRPATRPATLGVREFLTRGVGEQIGVHVYDATYPFDFSLPEFAGEMLRESAGRGSPEGGGDVREALAVPLIGAVIASLNSPAYVSVPVRDEKVVDAFLDRLDVVLAAAARQSVEGGPFFAVRQDFYTLPQGRPVRCYALRLGPLTLRVFWARIGKGLYLASKRFILDDLASAEAEAVGVAAAAPAARDPDATAHAMLRLRPQNWDQALSDFRLGWAENNRRACLDNLGPLSSAARVHAAGGKIAGGKAASPAGAVDGSSRAAADVHRLADRIYGAHFFCPEGGHYLSSPDGKSVTCSVHGSSLSPRQPPAPSDDARVGQLLQSFSGLTASLMFREDGLRAVVVVERSKP